MWACWMNWTPQRFGGEENLPLAFDFLDFLFPSCLDCTLRGPSGSSLLYVLQMEVELIIKRRTPPGKKNGGGGGAAWENHPQKSDDGI